MTLLDKIHFWAIAFPITTVIITINIFAYKTHVILGLAATFLSLFPYAYARLYYINCSD